MTSLRKLTGKFARGLNWLPPQRGYVGIDIGSHAIKLAQVQRSGDRWEIAAKWLLPLDERTAAPDGPWLERVLESVRHELIDLRGIFAGREVAVSLPMSLTTLRCLEVPAGSEQEVRTMAFDELCDDFGGKTDFTFDLWDMAPRPAATASGGEGMLHLTAFSTRNDLATRTAEGLLSAGYECHVLDALPCALARCAQMAAPELADQPSVALDLGHHTPQIVVCRNGRPSFCRILPDCGLRSLMEPLRERLRLSERECQQLLSRLGISSLAGGTHASAATRAVTQLLGPKLTHLTGEVERTLAYVGQQFRDQYPKQMWIFGGGASIGNLPDLLSARLGIPVRPWTPRRTSTSSGDNADSQFAVAAALSLLAWEERRCT